MKSRLKVIVGGQYGSEAKGSVAAHLARTCERPLMAIRVAGPNAGHTVYSDDGVRYPLRSIPVAAVARPGSMLGIAAGSEVDYRVLEDEMRLLEDDGFGPLQLMIDQQATVLDQEHHMSEARRAMHDRLGSTGKGIGAARAARIMRDADIVGGDADVADRAHYILGKGGEVHIEGTQGYGLGLHAGHYPFCTSSDCRAIDFMAMTGIMPWDPVVDDFEVWVTFRTYPIRVAGNSGPLNDETSFENLSRSLGVVIEPERTTVTNKVRRIGRWDRDLAAEAIKANGTDRVRLALMFVDYLHPQAYGATAWDQLPVEAVRWIEREENALGLRFDLLGTGPRTIIDRRYDQHPAMPGQTRMEV